MVLAVLNPGKWWRRSCRTFGLHCSAFPPHSPMDRPRRREGAALKITLTWSRPCREGFGAALDAFDPTKTDPGLVGMCFLHLTQRGQEIPKHTSRKQQKIPNFSTKAKSRRTELCQGDQVEMLPCLSPKLSSTPAPFPAIPALGRTAPFLFPPSKHFSKILLTPCESKLKGLEPSGKP